MYIAGGGDQFKVKVISSTAPIRIGSQEKTYSGYDWKEAGLKASYMEFHFRGNINKPGTEVYQATDSAGHSAFLQVDFIK